MLPIDTWKTQLLGNTKTITVKTKRAKVPLQYNIIVDDDMYDDIIKHSIYVYTQKTINLGDGIYFHIRISTYKYTTIGRYVLGIDTPGTVVTHKNGNFLDFRKCNLFVDTNKLLSKSVCKLIRKDPNRSSEYCGVRNLFRPTNPNSKRRNNVKYWGIHHNGKYLRFETEVEAATEWGNLHGFDGPVKRTDISKYI